MRGDGQSAIKVMPWAGHASSMGTRLGRHNLNLIMRKQVKQK